MKLNKFYPTKNWRRRGKLHDLVHELESNVGCLVYADNNHLYDKGNFEYALKETPKIIKKLSRFYWRNK